MIFFLLMTTLLLCTTSLSFFCSHVCLFQRVAAAAAAIAACTAAGWYCSLSVTNQPHQTRPDRRITIDVGSFFSFLGAGYPPKCVE